MEGDWRVFFKERKGIFEDNVLKTTAHFTLDFLLEILGMIIHRIQFDLPTSRSLFKYG